MGILICSLSWESSAGSGQGPCSSGKRTTAVFAGMEQAQLSIFMGGAAMKRAAMSSIACWMFLPNRLESWRERKSPQLHITASSSARIKCWAKGGGNQDGRYPGWWVARRRHQLTLQRTIQPEVGLGCCRVHTPLYNLNGIGGSGSWWSSRIAQHSPLAAKTAFRFCLSMQCGWGKDSSLSSLVWPGMVAS